MTRKPHITVEHRHDGWPKNHGRQPGTEGCRSVLPRLRRGLDVCDDTACWKATRTDKYGSTTGYYCGEDLPEDIFDSPEFEAALTKVEDATGANGPEAMRLHFLNEDPGQ
ncbi:hypothetical protein [Nocardiopsis nanhaiensis]